MSATSLHTVLGALLDELIDGAGDRGWVLNPGDPGLLASLDRLSAQQASALPPRGGASIAAHVDHLRYGLALLNRWQHGESPFDDADYAASWSRTAVSELEWDVRRAALSREAHGWRRALETLRDPSPEEWHGVVGSVVHLAYHLGAIRQLDRATTGPAASD
jgi:hypothetical protein